MSDYKIRTSCAICNNTDLKTIIEFGKVPLAGDFPNEESLDDDKKYDLSIQFCTACSLLQTNSSVDADVLFKDYRYSSSVGLSGHFTDVAKTIKDKFNPKNVLEIGSNDGVLLKPLNDLGINAVGVDPATNICRIAESKGCSVYNEYFNENFVSTFGLETSFDFIVSNNCFAHIEDIQSIVRGVKKALIDGGHFQIEVHYVKPLIEKLQYDTVYHEHLYYYSLTALHSLFKKHEMTIVDFEEISTHAGSIRVVVKNSQEELSQKVSERLRMERGDWKLTSLDYYTSFSRRVTEHITTIKNKLKELKLENKKIVGFGASGRANMLCNLANITPDIVDYIVDESPERHGRYTAGTHIPIVNKEYLDKDIEKPDYILILAWNFSSMIMDKLTGNDYNYLVAFPEWSIIYKKESVNVL